MTTELMAKVKAAKDAEELLALAKENGYPLAGEEEAKALFAQLNATGELADEELDAVSGGGCKKNGYTVVTTDCKCFTGQYKDGWQYGNCLRDDAIAGRTAWHRTCAVSRACGDCYHLEFSGYLGYCGVSK